MLQHGKRPTIASRHGMVAAAHPLAAAAGARILSNGGNAFDAAAATAATLNVVEPYMSGLAGMGMATCYIASERRVRSLNFMSLIPRKFPLEKLNRREQIVRGPIPVGSPGNLGGSRHYFFRISEQDTIAFFEFLDVETPADNSLLGAGNHLAITVPSETELQNAKTLLEANGVKIKSDLDHGFCHSIYFEDPVNKVALEFATWKHACDAEEPFLQDPNPVPAALEAIGQDKYSRFQLHYSPDGHGGAEPRN